MSQLPRRFAAFFVLPALLPSPFAAAQGSVTSELQWSGASATLPVAPNADDGFGGGVEPLGDVDGDGIPDVAVGLAGVNLAPLDGQVWIQFLNADGSVRATQAIGEGAGDFPFPLDRFDRFGRALASLGDLDGDGVVDLAVSAHGDDDGGSAQGAVWILFLRADGTVKTTTKISETQGGFPLTLDPNDFFGLGLTSLGDLDGDGNTDLMVAAPYDDDGSTNRGAVYVLFLNSDGTVKNATKISSTVGLFFGQLDTEDLFGLDALAHLGDLDGDGLTEVAVGAANDDDGGMNRGAVWILELLPTGLVSSWSKISQTSGGFTGALQDSDIFGGGVELYDDLNGDGTPELIVGAYSDDPLLGANRGAIWILFLQPDGTVNGQEEIGQGMGGFGGLLGDDDLFGIDIANVGDVDGDGDCELLVGVMQSDVDASDAGGAWLLHLDPCSLPASTSVRNAGTNPMSYTAALPRLDQTWTATVDLTTTGHSFAIVFGFDTALSLPLSGGQTLLCFDGLGSGELLGFPLQPGPLATFVADVPYFPNLCGTTIPTQAIHFGGIVPFALSNAIDLQVGI